MSFLVFRPSENKNYRERRCWAWRCDKQRHVIRSKLLPIHSSHFWSFVSIWYVTKLSSAQFPFAQPAAPPTNDTSACFRQHGEEICQMQETISIMNVPCCVCPNVRQIYAETLMCLEGKPETCQKIILFRCKCLKQYIYCIYIHTKLFMVTEFSVCSQSKQNFLRVI